LLLFFGFIWAVKIATEPACLMTFKNRQLGQISTDPNQTWQCATIEP